MNTLFDFVSNVNAMQYGLALLFVAGFVVFTEILKARPFAQLKESAAEDIRFIRSQGREKNTQLLKNLVSAPLYLVTYIASVPFLFVKGMAEPLGSLTTAGWSPVRAYFTGSRKAKKIKAKDSGPKASR